MNTEAGLLITPDRKVVPLNKTVRTSTEERREVTLPDGRKMNGLFKITNEELGGWQKESIAADQARRAAKCIQSYIDTIVSKLPNYFTSSMIGLPIQDNGDKLSDTSFEFLSNTKIEVAMPTLRNLDKAILTLRLIPPFLLNDLSTALEGDRRTVPSFLGSPVIISAELLYNDADVMQLSSTSQDLRAFLPTEWLWLVEPNRSGEMTAFVKFTVTGQGGDAKQDVPFLYQLNFRVQTNLWGSITGFIAGNWQWIAGTLVVPLSIYLFHAFWPKKAKRRPGYSASSHAANDTKAASLKSRWSTHRLGRSQRRMTAICAKGTAGVERSEDTHPLRRHRLPAVTDFACRDRQNGAR